MYCRLGTLEYMITFPPCHKYSILFKIVSCLWEKLGFWFCSHYILSGHKMYVI